MTENVLPLTLIGVLMVGVAMALVVVHANSGEHVRFAGNAWEIPWTIPTGDRVHVAQHAWRPGADGNAITVNDLARRLADEARLEAQSGRHRLDPEQLIADDTWGDDEPTQQLYTQELLAA